MSRKFIQCEYNGFKGETALLFPDNPPLLSGAVIVPLDSFALLGRKQNKTKLNKDNFPLLSGVAFPLDAAHF